MKTTNQITLALIAGFAGRLREEREKQGLTQTQLGAMSGTSGQWISHYEKGRRAPSLVNLIAIATALDCSTDFLLGRE